MLRVPFHLVAGKAVPIMPVRSRMNFEIAKILVLLTDACKVYYESSLKAFIRQVLAKFHSYFTALLS